MDKVDFEAWLDEQYKQNATDTDRLRSAWNARQPKIDALKADISAAKEQNTILVNTEFAHEREIENLKAEVEKLRADAERYRWLRSNARIDWVRGDGAALVIPEPDTGRDWETDTDEHIDAAMKATAAPTPPERENQWQKAVLNECFAIEGCYKESDPVGTLACLINWHVLNERDHAPAQEAEPVAWMIPSIMKVSGTGNEEIDGTVAWGASVFCDSRDQARTDKNGVKHYPLPLYTHPANDELRQVAEDVLQIADNNSLNSHEWSGLMETLRTALEKK